MSSITEKELLTLIDARLGGVDADDFQRLSTIVMELKGLADLRKMDPFSLAYRREMEALYARLSSRKSYSPEQDETSGLPIGVDVWRGLPPFSFGQSKFVADFLQSWAAIFDALDVRPGQSVLEYGPGSGQILLMLARTGIDVFGVDIDASYLGHVKTQADAMSLPVNLERAEFGEGFGDMKFDRILFFEAFHHALHFEDLLLRLHDRLNTGGKIIFCGEPIVNGAAGIPYPWGPRMDALSIYCMRRNGWMELGFTHDFFVELAMRSGWLLEHRPTVAGRSSIYIAEAMGSTIQLGSNIALPPGWGAPEGTHRWTHAERVTLPLPALSGNSRSVKLEMLHPLRGSKTVTVRAGEKSAAFSFGRTFLSAPNNEWTATIDGITAPELAIETTLSRAEGDPRPLGIAVKSCVMN